MNSFETNRLILRGFQGTDYQDLYDYLSDEEVVKFEPYEPFSLSACKEEASIRAKNKSFIAVELKETGKVIGNLFFQKCHFETWELGYVFNRHYQKQGYATECIKELFHHAFEGWNVRRIIAMCNPENENSWKLLERVGMEREGHLKKNIYFTVNDDNEPNWQDTYEYGLLREDYIKNK